MKVCGFSFIRNGVKFDFPFEQAYRSILPICDKLYIAVGQSEDETRERVRAISDKIIIIDTVWDESQKEGGKVFAMETDKAFQAVAPEYDWAFYIQGDEVLHEDYLQTVQKAMQTYLNDDRVDGLLFNYRHFFGSYDYVGAKYSWYRREIRVIRNNKKIYSYGDAQGFRKNDNEKLRVKLIDAYIYHYGWVRNPQSLQKKINANIHIYQGNDADRQKEELRKDTFDYSRANEPVEKYRGTHPALMHGRIAAQNWDFRPENMPRYASAKDKLKRIVRSLTGLYIGEYKNYILI